MKFIMTAFTNLDLALKLLAVAEDGFLKREHIKDGESIRWQSGQSLVVLPDRTFNSDEDFILALQNNVQIAFGAAAITLDVCRQEIGLSVPQKIVTERDQLVALIYQIRCCFAHDIAEPRWVIRNQKYKRVYDLGCKQINLSNLDGKHFEYDDIGGLDTLGVMRVKLIGH
jgi:hypothetical protein